MFQIRLIKLCPRLHDEGGQAAEGISTTAANDSQPVSGEVQVVYGKSDPQADVASTSEAPAVDQSTDVDRSAKYSQFKNDYKDLYESDFKQALDRRMKGRDKESTQLKTLLDPVMQYFGHTDIKQLEAFVKDYIIPNTEGYQAKDIQLALEGEDGDGDTKSVSEAKETPPADLGEQAAALAEKLSALGLKFDQEKDTKDPVLSDFMAKGLTLEQAYNLARHDDILKAVAENQRKATIEAIRTKGIDRVAEHASKPAPPVIRKVDPSQFTDADIKAVIQQARSGKEIRF